MLKFPSQENLYSTPHGQGLVMSSANSIQIGGSHYQKHGMQHWDYAAIYFGAGFFKGNATKYIVRWRDKGGVKDLQKAAHYIEKLIELVQEGRVELGHSLNGAQHIETFISSQQLIETEADLVRGITFASGILTLKAILIVLNRHIEQVHDTHLANIPLATE